MQTSTIAAISSAPGLGAVGIVRLSGPSALTILKKIFQPKNFHLPWKAQAMRLGKIHGPDNTEIIDEALAVYFPGPRSYTGEEAAEIYGHGGQVVLSLILQAALAAGAELAEAGEFTRRAFLNGRLDLSQAEAVGELIAAQSQAEIKLALRQLEGGLKEAVEPAYQSLVNALTQVEAALDFGEETDDLNLNTIANLLTDEIAPPLQKLLQDRQAGHLFKDGLKIALAGAPNVGKSSLFNALLEEDRALVSGIAGTTRDAVSSQTLWQGLRLELCDTAGLSQKPQDELDALGQERSLKVLAEADIILLVKDLSSPGEETKITSSPAQKVLEVWNKSDLPDATTLKKKISGLVVSAKTGAGLKELKDAILLSLQGQGEIKVPELVPNLRHQKILEKTLEKIQEALNAIIEGQVPEIVALELRTALDILGQISGHKSPDDVLGEIFGNFCLGK